MNINKLKNIYDIANIILQTNLIDENSLLSKIENIEDKNNRYEITFVNEKEKNIIFIYLNELLKFEGYIIKNNENRQKIKFENRSLNNKLYILYLYDDNSNEQEKYYFLRTKQDNYKLIMSNDVLTTYNKNKRKKLLPN